MEKVKINVLHFDAMELLNIRWKKIIRKIKDYATDKFRVVTVTLVGCLN